MSELNPLSPMQTRFCEEYVTDLNGTQAAIRAGYASNSANVQASQLLIRPNIQKYVQELKDQRRDSTQITAARVIEELAKIGLASGENKLDGWDTVDLKDKLKALEMLARHSGAFNSDESSKTVLKVTIGGND